MRLLHPLREPGLSHVSWSPCMGLGWWEEACEETVQLSWASILLPSLVGGAGRPCSRELKFRIKGKTWLHGEERKAVSVGGLEFKPGIRMGKSGMTKLRPVESGVAWSGVGCGAGQGLQKQAVRSLGCEMRVGNQHLGKKPEGDEIRQRKKSVWCGSDKILVIGPAESLGVKIAHLHYPYWAEMPGSLPPASLSQWMQATQEECDPGWHRRVHWRQTLKELRADVHVLTVHPTAGPQFFLKGSWGMQIPCPSQAVIVETDK